MRALAILGATGAALAVGCSGELPVDLFRSDIREGKSGAELALTITVVNTAASWAPLTGVTVEIWQCDASGNYSQYGSERAQTYLRGYRRPMPTGRPPSPRSIRAGTSAPLTFGLSG